MAEPRDRLSIRLVRPLVQAGFLGLTLVAVFLVRANAERWCPLGGVEALRAFLQDRSMPCSLGISNLYIFAGLLGVTLLVRRAFCGYACPIGTLSEWVQRGARRLGLRAWEVPPRLERGLGVLKYALLAVILFFTYRAGELVFRGYDPAYALLSRNGEDITAWAYVVAGGIVLGSLLVSLPFCRWLCPLAAALDPFSRAGWMRVRRDPAACSGCMSCARACPMALPVDRVETVTAARCTACMECVEACPEKGKGAIGWSPRRWLRAAPVAVLLAVVGVAVTAAYRFPVASFVHERGTPPAVTRTVALRIPELTCRGRATLLTFFLDRDDLLALPGYLRLEAWPEPQGGRARIAFEPARTSDAAIRRAIAEPYYDLAGDRWHLSPFTVTEEPGGTR